MILLLIYVVGIFGFCLWDSWIGMPVVWSDNTEENRERFPLGIAAVTWPIAVPIVSLIKFNKYLDEAKERRIEKELHKQRLRIAAQREVDIAMEQMDAEMKKASLDKRV